MQNNSIKKSYRGISTFILLAFLNISAFAQDAKIEVKGEDMGNWFSRNWMWVTAVAVVLLLLLLFSGSSRSRRNTTVVTDNNGNVRRTTTTEVEEA